jgi:hypothetical protein
MLGVWKGTDTAHRVRRQNTSQPQKATQTTNHLVAAAKNFHHIKREKHLRRRSGVYDAGKP